MKPWGMSFARALVDVAFPLPSLAANRVTSKLSLRPHTHGPRRPPRAA